MGADLAQHAEREATAALRLGGGDDVFAPATFDIDLPGAMGVPKANAWRPALSDAMEKRVFPWVNGRRSALEIAERLQFSGAVELGEVVAALERMAAAGVVAFG